MQKLRMHVVLLVVGPGLGFWAGVSAQSRFWDSRNAYLGQQLAGDTPRAFAPDLLTSKDKFSLDRVADGRGRLLRADVLDGWADFVRGSWISVSTGRTEVGRRRCLSGR
jgi:hypothetical protein